MSKFLQGRCNRARLYVTKQFCRFHFVVLFISVPTENVRFGYALQSSSSVVFLPHDECVGRQMIKFITPQYASFVLGKTAKITTFLYLLCCYSTYMFCGSSRHRKQESLISLWLTQPWLTNRIVKNRMSAISFFELIVYCAKRVHQMPNTSQFLTSQSPSSSELRTSSQSSKYFQSSPLTRSGAIALFFLAFYCCLLCLCDCFRIVSFGPLLFLL